MLLAAPAPRVTATAAVNSHSSGSKLQPQQRQRGDAGTDACTDAYADAYSGDSAEEYDAAVETCNRRTGWEKSNSNSYSYSNSKFHSAELAAAKLQALEDRAAVAAARQLSDQCAYVAAATECSLSGNAAEPDEYEVTELAENSMVSFFSELSPSFRVIRKVLL
jgi:hypothetical protein